MILLLDESIHLEYLKNDAIKFQLEELKNMFTLKVEIDLKKKIVVKENLVPVLKIKEILRRLIEVSPNLIRLESFKKKIVVKNDSPPPSYLQSRINFVGRKDYLQRIHSVYADDKKKIVVLSSFSGSGKSALANEFGYQFKKSNNYVYWIKSDGNSSVFELKRLFEINEKNDDERKNERNFVARKIVHTIFKLKELNDFLFIFDNCDNYLAIDEFITQLSDLKNTKILITTKDSSLLKKSNFDNKTSELIYLEPFNEAESIEYLLTKFENSKKEEIKELINLCQPSKQIRPIVLDKIYRYFKLNPLESFSSLISGLKDKEKNYCKNKIIDYDLFGSVKKMNPIAWDILKYSSFFDPDFIFIELYKDFSGLDLKILIDDVQFLLDLSLIIREHKNDEIGLKIHETIQSEAFEFFKSNYTNEYIDLKETSITKLIELLADKKTDKQKKLKYFYHFKRIIDTSLDEKNEKIAKAAVLLAAVLVENYKYRESLKYHEESLAIFRKLNNDKDKYKIFELILLKNMAHILFVIGKFDEAIESYQQVIIIERILNHYEDNVNVSNTLNSIGMVLV